ncbi:MAG: glycosyltransferase, partial [Candidatus Igneacidithiobacillus chanchocoensis]
MRIVIDLQGAQCASRTRGIGRFALQFAKAFARLAQPQHEIVLALNGAFDDTLDALQQEFSGLLGKSQFQIFRPVSPCHALDESNLWRRRASELLYEQFIASLSPDFLIITSLFEGKEDDAVSSIDKSERIYPVAVVLYDLIPLLNPKLHLGYLPLKKWYYRSLEHLHQADFLLAISESSRTEGLHYLSWPAERVINVSCAADARFQKLAAETGGTTDVSSRLGITKPFVLYAGAFDPHKNVKHLIEAFAKLRQPLRDAHQLVLVHSIDKGTQQQLLAFAAEKGLNEQQLVFPGWVTDEELIALYKSCALFVFPSLHEGFGLPVLEAMSCGAPTLASNSTSLPEVLGWDEALFNPEDSSDIARHMERALSDVAFRNALIEHGLRQAKNFSWERTAQRALDALEAWRAQWQSEQAQVVSPPSCPHAHRPRLAYFSPLQPAQSGIADYSAELLPALSRHYAIDVIVAQPEAVTDPWVLGNAPIRSLAWFERNSQLFDRVLYQFGNSEFHAHQFDLIQRYPGVVVLHDFFLSGVLAWVLENRQQGVWPQALLDSHGWPALMDARRAQDATEIIMRYPANLPVLQAALGVIVHAEYSRKLAAQFYGAGFAEDWAHIKHLRVPVAKVDRMQARSDLGIAPDTFLVCSFGLLGPMKLNHRLLAAWQRSSLAQDANSQLVFVGKNDQGEYGAQIQQTLQTPPFASQARISGWAEEETYRLYLQAADVAVQLRTLSRGETSGTVLDCMNYGIPTIVNANGSMAELPAEAVLMLPDTFSDAELSAALERLWRNPALRSELGVRARACIEAEHAPRHCAAQYAKAIEGAYAQAQKNTLGMAQHIARLGAPDDPQDLSRLAQRMAELCPPKRPAWRQLLVDVSEMARSDAKTGIQRVVRSVLQELFEYPPTGFTVEPVYATAEHSYRYARRFTAGFLDLGDLPLNEDPVEIAPGDIFWGVDWQPNLVPQHWQTLAEWRQRGVKVVFTVHDILPLIQAETTFESVTAGHRRWMETIARADALLCVSNTVMRDVADWLENFASQNSHPVHLGWAHHGANIVKAVEGHAPNTREQARQLAAIRRYPAFLMVGTLEPRKMQDQALAAFEWLWRQGVQANLVIVGKAGWKTEALAERLRQHTERERHLFWLEGISDDYLEQVYEASTCLIAASKNEGFGLPLIEAAMRKLPIIARDIPVFREVCGEHALYFTGYAPQDLARAVQAWLELQAQGQAPSVEGMPWMTWAQATEKMLDCVLRDQWQSEWQPKKDDTLMARYWGSDDRLKTQIGAREGRAIISTGHPGHLLFGPYLNLKPGRYVAEIRGAIGCAGTGDALADICVDQGKTILAQALIEANTHDPNLIARLAFSLAEAQEGLEVRIEVTEHSDLHIDELIIRRDDGRRQIHSAESSPPEPASTA